MASLSTVPFSLVVKSTIGSALASNPYLILLAAPRRGLHACMPTCSTHKHMQESRHNTLWREMGKTGTYVVRSQAASLAVADSDALQMQFRRVSIVSCRAAGRGAGVTCVGVLDFCVALLLVRRGGGDCDSGSPKVDDGVCFCMMLRCARSSNTCLGRLQSSVKTVTSICKACNEV